MVTASDALMRLRLGNRRFRAGAAPGPYPTEADRAELARAQTPFAAILGCSDSRVPVEAVFDQGFGDLFVVRVAGNVAGPTEIASLEFAVDPLGVRLIVVLGHSGCGAVAAALQAVQNPGAPAAPGSIGELIDEIRPAVEEVAADGATPDGELARRAVRAHVSRSVHRLRHDSPVLAARIAPDDVWVVGAEFDVPIGRVEFLETDGGEGVAGGR